MLSIGLMSGTSMDGIDCALLETDGSANLLRDLGHISISYDVPTKILLKAAEHAVRCCMGNMAQAKSAYVQALKDYLSNELKISPYQIDNEISALAQYLHQVTNTDYLITFDKVVQHSTQLHAKAVKKLLQETAYQPKQIDVVGYHGQALLHRPNQGISIIVGEGAPLAEKVGITVVNDFRRCDIACGGQGAPFAPLYHHALALRDQLIPVAVVNCGGIANITIICNSNEFDCLGFDTGPGNGLIDRLVRQRTHGKECHDDNGQYGIKGEVNNQVLQALYQKALIKDGQNYFSIKPPKSLDIGDMVLIPEIDALSLADACATLEAFTADTIVDSLDFLHNEIPRCFILAGGGWHNPVIRSELEHKLTNKLGKGIQILTADEAGWNSQAMEAQIFAYLAVRSLQNKPLSIPSTTRVPEPLSGGHAYVPSNGATKTVQELLKQNPAVLSGYQTACFDYHSTC